MDFIVTENTEINLNGNKYLLEKGDVIIVEKWKGDTEIEQTGEHAGKTVEELRQEAKNLKEKQRKNDKADPKITEQLREINFAIRAKTGWKKGKGATK